MLRNDAIYLIDKDQDSHVPTTDMISSQVGKHVGYVYGSVRLATGRVIGSDNKKPKSKKRRRI